ncbi:putative F-box protein At2g36090 [Wolffia australiana]
MEELHGDVLVGVLRLLDGRSLAAVGCASAQLRAAAARRELWEELCYAAWPALRQLAEPVGAPAGLFADAQGYPAREGRRVGGGPPAALVSVVELAHEGRRVLSRAVRTEARGRWFGCSPFRVDAVALDEWVAAPGVAPEGLSLDWVMVDPAAGRAVKLACRRPVEIERRWYTGEIVVRFGALLGGGGAAAVAVVALAEETMEVRETRLMVEDADGAALNGRDALAVLAAALAGERRRGEEEVFQEYAVYAREAAARKEMRLKGRGGAVLTLYRLAAAAAAAVAAAAFLYLWSR